MQLLGCNGEVKKKKQNLAWSLASKCSQSTEKANHKKTIKDLTPEEFSKKKFHSI